MREVEKDSLDLITKVSHFFRLLLADAETFGAPLFGRCATARSTPNGRTLGIYHLEKFIGPPLTTFSSHFKEVLQPLSSAIIE